MSDLQKGLLLAGALLLGWLVYLLGPVLTPFLVAALLAYLGDPLVDRLQRLKLARTPAVLVVFAGLLLAAAAALVVVVPLAQRQLAALLERAPAFVDWLQNVLVPWVNRLLPEGEGLDLGRVRAVAAEHWQQAGGAAAGLLAGVSRSGLALLGWLANLVLIPVVTFYLLRDWDALVARVHGLLPPRMAPAVAGLAAEADEVLGAFVRGQLLVMLALGVIYSAGLALVGLDTALLIGMLAGLVSVVPYLGFIVGLASAGVAVLVQTHEVAQLLPVLGVFVVGQALEGTVLTPWLVGDRIGLHPVAVIFAVLAGGQLFGFVGVLLALPVAAVLVVALRHAHRRYMDAGAAGTDGPSP